MRKVKHQNFALFCSSFMDLLTWKNWGQCKNENLCQDECAISALSVHETRTCQPCCHSDKLYNSSSSITPTSISNQTNANPTALQPEWAVQWRSFQCTFSSPGNGFREIFCQESYIPDLSSQNWVCEQHQRGHTAWFGEVSPFLEPLQNIWQHSIRLRSLKSDVDRARLRKPNHQNAMGCQRIYLFRVCHEVDSSSIVEV